MRGKTIMGAFLLSLAVGLAAPQQALAVDNVNGTTVYVSDNKSTFDPGGATYSRIICLKHNSKHNGSLLCTFDQLKKVSVQGSTGKKYTKQVYPIYRSSDDGKTWKLVTNVFDEKYQMPRTSQPSLFELSKPIGDMPKGTVILAGNIFDDSPYKQSHLVLFKSLDGGDTWSFLSQVDQGGPCVYDPGVNATTTAVWEPSLGISKDGQLVCYYSDERQKKNGVLQAVSLRASSDGIHWGQEYNVSAIPDKHNRPGMITVSNLPNGKYIATYEVVNQPSLTENNAIVYCKFSDDGIHWNDNSLGTRIALSNGRGIGSSPYVKWVDAGGPNGMVIVSAKWGADKDDHISGGQNFYVNYNLGKGAWERLPMAVTYDATDREGGYFSGFSQSFDTSIDGSKLFQATNVENLHNKKQMNGKTYNLNDVRVGNISLNQKTYEAELATLKNVKVEQAVDASDGREVRYINEPESSISFQNVKVDKSGSYTLRIRYSNGEKNDSSHSITINGKKYGSVYYSPTANWDRYQWQTTQVPLNKGMNVITFQKETGYAELDCISISDESPDFILQNQNSKKYLEVKSAATQTGASIGQWGITRNLCQNWEFEPDGRGYYFIKNVNSGLYLDIKNQSTENGAIAVQERKSSTDSQKWKLVDHGDGFFYIQNKHSGKFLEVSGNSAEDGATVGQWDNTGYGCQLWRLISEGTK